MKTNYPSATSLLRNRYASDSGRVGMVELFFDLVFVFAVTQISQTLLARPNMGTAVEIFLIIAGVWWAWIYTSWVTNWLDPERLPVRACLFALMLAGLVMSASIPQAFDNGGLSFAAAYVAIQLGRTLFIVWAVRHESAAMRRNFQRILVWFILSSVIWIAGGLDDSRHRLAWWSLALIIEIIAPALYFWMPGLGRSSVTDWNVDGGHMAERCALFVIIALGESLLATGATFSRDTPNISSMSKLVSAFFSNIAMWWLYFHRSIDTGHHRITHSSAPGRYATVSYTYLHLPIVAGIIISAVADNMVLTESHRAGMAPAIITISGPVLYLAGVTAFKWVSNTRRLPPLSHIFGLALLAALAWPATHGEHALLTLHAMTTIVLIATGTLEEITS